VRILVLSPEIPFPPIGGAALRTAHLVEALTPHHSVTVVGFDVRWSEWDAGAPAVPVELVRVPHHGHRSPWLVAEGGADAAAASRSMRSALRDLSRRGFEVALIEHSWMGQYIDALPPGIPRVLDLHNVHARGVQGGGEPVARNWVRDFERAVAARCDLCLTVSEEEADAARALLGVADPQVIPNPVDLDRFAPAPGPTVSDSLLFTGFLAYPPNIDAVRFFVGAVLPQVVAGAPRATFHVVGAAPTDEVRAMASRHVAVHGFVPDVRPHLHRAAVVVVPLRRGGGTRIKILEAAACGKAIVSTSAGVEGLRFRPGRDLIVADHPEGFAEAVVGLLRSPERRRELGRSAREAVAPYGVDQVMPRFLALVEGLAGGGSQPPR
jgi:glycosyltransferase involved in cell wall biosynthesis